MFNQLSEIWQLVILYAPTVLCGIIAVVLAIKLGKTDVNKTLNKYVNRLNTVRNSTDLKVNQLVEEIKVCKAKQLELEDNVQQALIILANTVKDTQDKLSELIKRENTEVKAELRRKKGE